MSKKLCTLLISFIMVVNTGIIFAAPVETLDDIVNQATQEQEENTSNENSNNAGGQSAENQPVNTNNGGTQVSSGSKLIDDLGDVAKMDDMDSSTVQKIADPLTKIVATVVQILCYVITLGMVLRVMLDLVYITVPFLRPFLGGNNAMMGQPNNGSSVYNNNNNSGYGGYGDNYGGYGGGYGGYGGGYGSRYGGYGGGMNGMNGANGMNGNNTISGGGLNFRLVSNAAVRASVVEDDNNANGGVKGVLSVYAKDMGILLVATPVLMILAISGALTSLGFVIGEAISTLIGSIGSMM